MGRLAVAFSESIRNSLVVHTSVPIPPSSDEKTAIVVVNQMFLTLIFMVIYHYLLPRLIRDWEASMCRCGKLGFSRSGW